MNKIWCEKCERDLNENLFYTRRDGSKPKMCKKCMTMHIDNFNPDTFTWLLEELDIPYVPGEWNSIREKAYAQDPEKVNGMSVFGRYLSKMKLNQWIDPDTGQPYGWKDSERLQAKETKRLEKDKVSKKMRDEELKKQYEDGVLNEAQYKTLVSSETLYKEILNKPPTEMAAGPTFQTGFVDKNTLPDPAESLTEKDKIYLAMKWGTLYRPQEWVELEKKYKEMEESFDIQDADTIHTLLLICKTDLKMNQALDVGDIEGFQKLSKVSNDLRKSAKFTAAQKKEKDAEEFDCVGAIVAFCEKEGSAIPRYDIKANPDLVDTIINNMKNYTRSLIENDSNINQQIEKYLKLLEVNLQQKQDKQKAKELGVEKLELTDKDMMDFNAAIEADRQADKELLEGEVDE